ncbi:MAG TPA: cytochrome P460 family protein [Steroidobacteraceae bacterium]|nr:cytochrome P460 family protein [Steroidobacteraceae bacterium]
MRTTTIQITVIGAASLVVFAGITLADQDKYTLKVPDGLSFAEVRGYETWQDVAVSETKTQVKAILGNQVTIDAYKEGIPGNGKPFPDGAKWVKIQWNKKQNTVSPYFVEVPATLASIAFIVKDSKRFPKTHGYAFGQFDYDTATGTFGPGLLGSVPVTGTECGYACHAAHVASTDYIFTAYPPR